MAKQDVEEFYDSYSKDYENDYLDRFVDSLFEHFLNEYLPQKKGLKILDAGGGIGRFSMPLAKKGQTIILTDISQGMLDSAKKIIENQEIKNISLIRESVTEMKNQKSGYFDVILLMNGVLDYCNDPQKALEEVFRVLKTGGVVIGTVNNRFIYTTTNLLLEEKDLSKFEEAFKTGNYFKKFKIHDFTLKEIEELLSQNNFKILDIFGPTNLLRKWEISELSKKVDRDFLFELQIDFAKRKEYINNSSDFFFVAEKRNN